MLNIEINSLSHELFLLFCSLNQNLYADGEEKATKQKLSSATKQWIRNICLLKRIQRDSLLFSFSRQVTLFQILLLSTLHDKKNIILLWIQYFTEIIQCSVGPFSQLLNHIAKKKRNKPRIKKKEKKLYLSMLFLQIFGFSIYI